MRNKKEEANDQYPWLDKDDERRNMSDKEISEKYIDLRKIMPVRIRNERSNGYVIQV